jgi:hypothetical protein
MIKVYALKTWLVVRNFYNKQKYNLLVYKEANTFLKKWKRFSPETFKMKGKSNKELFTTEADSNVDAITPLPKPVNTITDTGNLKMILPETTFPVDDQSIEEQEQSKDYSGH